MCWKLKLGRHFKIEARALGDGLFSDTYLKSPGAGWPEQWWSGLAVSRKMQLVDHRYSGLWHPRLGHVRPSADGKTDSVNTRPVEFAAEAYKYLLDQKQSTHRDTVS